MEINNRVDIVTKLKKVSLVERIKKMETRDQINTLIHLEKFSKDTQKDNVEEHNKTHTLTKH